MRYAIWNKKDRIYTVIGEELTAEQWLARYPWAKNPAVKMIIGGGAINGTVAMEFDSTVEHYKKVGALITDNMTDVEILAAIEDFEDNPPVSDEPTVEERTAATLEFIALSFMPDEEV